MSTHAEYEKYLSNFEDNLVAFIISREQSIKEQAEREERAVLERLDADFKAIKCDECGRAWTPSDPHDVVLKRLEHLDDTSKR